VPITVTFDIRNPTSAELNRIRSFFERLGWEHLGNTAYRYPRLHETNSVEDWFNHVIPALMLLRAFARHAAATGRDIAKFSLDVQSTTGFNPGTDIGSPPLEAARISYTLPHKYYRAFGQRRLEDWIDSITWPYDPAATTGT
jgi:hypothetical protein